MKEQKIEEMRIAAQNNDFVFEQDKESEYDFGLYENRNLINFDCNIVNGEYWLYSFEGSVIEINSDPEKIIYCIKQILNF